jgi:hypothetical protein
LLVAKQVAAVQAQGQCQVGVEAALVDLTDCIILSKSFRHYKLCPQDTRPEPQDLDSHQKDRIPS